MLNKIYFVASFRYSFSRYNKYRANVFFSFFSELAIPICINVLFLVGLNGADASANALYYVIEYVVLANITYTISVTDMENNISNDIRTSALIYRLTEPVSPSISWILSDIATKAIRILLFYIPALFLLILLRRITVDHILSALLFMLLANVIGYSMSLIIGCLSFWITETWGISSVKNLVVAVAAGSVFPFSILPDAVRSILLCTPFPYLSYVPSAILLGELSGNMLVLLLIAIAWCVGFTFIAKMIWQVGKKKYESVGV